MTEDESFAWWAERLEPTFAEDASLHPQGAPAARKQAVLATIRVWFGAGSDTPPWPDAVRELLQQLHRYEAVAPEARGVARDHARITAGAGLIDAYERALAGAA